MIFAGENIVLRLVNAGISQGKREGRVNYFILHIKEFSFGWNTMTSG
jgi:hypothetical protein